MKKHPNKYAQDIDEQRGTGKGRGVSSKIRGSIEQTLHDDTLAYFYRTSQLRCETAMRQCSMDFQLSPLTIDKACDLFDLVCRSVKGDAWTDRLSDDNARLRVFNIIWDHEQRVRVDKSVTFEGLDPASKAAQWYYNRGQTLLPMSTDDEHAPTAAQSTNDSVLIQMVRQQELLHGELVPTELSFCDNDGELAMLARRVS